MDRDRLRADILRFLDGDLGPDEERALAASIRGNKEAEDLFAELMRFNGNITSLLSEAAGEKEARRELTGGKPSRTRSGLHRAVGPGGPSSATWIFVAAAAAAAVLIAIFASSGPEEPLRKPKAPSVVKKEEPREIPPPPPLPEKKAPLPEAPTPPLVPVPKPEKPAPPPVEIPASVPEAPKPAPAPPRPEPPPAPEPSAPRPTKAIVSVAILEGVKGDATVKTEKGKEPAKDGLALLPAQGLETGVGESAASLRFPDGSLLELAAESRIDQVTNGEGKKIVFDHGILTADVKKQAPGQALLVTTPHAEARVIGTKFTLTVKGDATRLEVQEGRVRLTRLTDGASTEVAAGFFAVAAAGPRPAAKRIAAPNPKLLLGDDFDIAAGFDARWQLIEGGFPTATRGKVEIDLSPRSGDSYAAGGWHVPGGIRAKQAFALPFRVSVDVEVTAKHDNLNALVALVPTTAKSGGLKNELAVRLRGSEYGLLVENNKVKTASVGGTFPLRSRWVIELDRQELRFWADGKEIAKQAHGLTITEDYRFELQGAAKADVPAGARVTFDNVKVEPVEK